MEKEKEFTVEDLTPQESEWFRRREEFFLRTRVAPPTKLLLAILKKGRE